MSREDKSNNIGLLAIGLALGLGITICFLLHTISINTQQRTMMPTNQAETQYAVDYIYDNKDRLKSIRPTKVTLKAVE